MAAGNTKNRSHNELLQKMVHALQSRDKQVLAEVLDVDDAETVKMLVKRLPQEYASVFLQEIQSGLYKKNQNINYLRWLQEFIICRLSFLRSRPKIEEELQPLLELLNTRVDVLDRIYRLKGKLQLMLSQEKAPNRTEKLSFQTPVISQSSSSSEEEEEEEEEALDELKRLMENGDEETEESANDLQDEENSEDSEMDNDDDDDVEDDLEGDDEGDNDDEDNDDIDMKSGSESD